MMAGPRLPEKGEASQLVYNLSKCAQEGDAIHMRCHGGRHMYSLWSTTTCLSGGAKCCMRLARPTQNLRFLLFRVGTFDLDRQTRAARRSKFGVLTARPGPTLPLGPSSVQ